MAGSQYQPKHTINPKKKAATSSAATMPVGLNPTQQKKWLADHGSSSAKTIDRWGLGTWTTTDANSQWGNALSWLLTGDTAAYNAVQIKVVGGKKYIGSDANGYTAWNGGSGGLRTEGSRVPRKGAGPARQSGVTFSADQFVDEWQGLAKKDPGRFGQVQSMLFQAGYYGADQPVVGSYAGIDQQAMLNAVNDAHTAGIPLQDFLKDKVDKRAAQGFSTGPRRVPLTVTLTDPTAITGALNAPASVTGTSNAAQAIGQNLDPTEVQAYIDKIHNGERSAQVAADNANPTYTGSGSTTAAPLAPGGTVVQQPGITGNDIDATLKAEHPAEYQATHMGEQASRILSILTAHAPGGMA